MGLKCEPVSYIDLFNRTILHVTTTTTTTTTKSHMKEGGSLQTLDLGFSSASVYGGDTVTAVELELYELFV